MAIARTPREADPGTDKPRFQPGDRARPYGSNEWLTVIGCGRDIVRLGSEPSRSANGTLTKGVFDFPIFDVELYSASTAAAHMASRMGDVEDKAEGELRTSDLTFGEAIERLKQGDRIARAGWNGKGMFVYLVKGSVASELVCPKPTHDDPLGMRTTFFGVGGVQPYLFADGPTGSVTRMPNLNMRAADGSIVTGWLASQTDILASDWCVVGDQS